jgi:hypothetical protein
VVEAIDSMVAVQREKTALLPFWNIKDVASKGSQATDLALMARLLLGGVVALEMVGTVGHVCAKGAETYGGWIRCLWPICRTHAQISARTTVPRWPTIITFQHPELPSGAELDDELYEGHLSVARAVPV